MAFHWKRIIHRDECLVIFGQEFDEDLSQIIVLDGHIVQNIKF